MAVAYVTWSEQQAIETIDSTEIFTGKISAYTTEFTARPILVKDKYRVNPVAVLGRMWTPLGLCSIPS